MEKMDKVLDTGFAEFLSQQTPSAVGMRMVDWEKVKELIESGEYRDISVGLLEDWSWTSAQIMEDGVLGVDEYNTFYGCSYWATPGVELVTNVTGETETYECWVEGDNKYLPSWIPVRED